MDNVDDIVQPGDEVKVRIESVPRPNVKASHVPGLLRPLQSRGHIKGGHKRDYIMGRTRVLHGIRVPLACQNYIRSQLR